MTRAARAVLVLALGALATLGALAAHAAPDAPAKAAPRFSHVGHLGLEAAKVNDCARCHTLDQAQRPRVPGGDGHQPCMSSGCHLSDFLDEKTTLCLACHATTENFRRNPLVDVYAAGRPREHVVEIDHKAHMTRGQPGRPDAAATCQMCHWVDRTTFVAVTRPGHAQCVACHGPTSPKPMTVCSTCHLEGDPNVYFAKQRRDVQLNGQFKHEHEGHRFLDGKRKTQPMQCELCHRTAARQTTLQALFAAPLVDRTTMQKTCSTCHDVRDVAKCTQCHTRGTIIKTFNYHGL